MAWAGRLFAFQLALFALAPPAGAAEKYSEHFHHRVKKALETVLDFDYHGPLTEVMADLSRRANVEIRIDRQALAAAEIEQEPKLALRVSRLSLENGLEYLLRPYDLTAVPIGRVLLVTTGFGTPATDRVLTLTHDVSRLGPFREDARALTDLVVAIVAPESWDAGGGSGTVSCQQGPDGAKTLVVSQTLDVHREIDALINRLGALADAVERGRNLPQPAPMPALQTKATASIRQAPLADALAELGRAYSAPIVLGPAALEEAVISPDQLVSCNARDATLEQTLGGLLHPLGLAYTEHLGAVLVTTQEEADFKALTEFYPVGDLARSDKALRELIGGIVSVVEPDSWDVAGGSSSLSRLSVHGRAATVVASTPYDSHTKLRRFLSHLRAVSTDIRRGAWRRAPLSPQLAKRADVALQRVPFEEALASLAKTYGAPIGLAPANREEGNPGDLTSPVTLHAGNLSLAEALDRLLEPRELDFLESESGIAVVSQEVADETFETLFYPIADLSLSERTLQGVLENLYSNVAPDTWDEHGGPGYMTTLSLRSERPQVAIVTQTQRVHRQVAAALQRGGVGK